MNRPTSYESIEPERITGWQLHAPVPIGTLRLVRVLHPDTGKPWWDQPVNQQGEYLGFPTTRVHGGQLVGVTVTPKPLMRRPDPGQPIANFPDALEMGVTPMVGLPNAAGQTKWEEQFFLNPKHDLQKGTIQGENGDKRRGLHYLGSADLQELLQFHIEEGIPVSGPLFAAMLLARERHLLALADRGEGIHSIVAIIGSIRQRFPLPLPHQLLTSQERLGMAHVKASVPHSPSRVVRVENGKGKDGVPGLALGVTREQKMILVPVYNPLSAQGGLNSLELPGGLGGPKEFREEAGFAGRLIGDRLPSFIANPATEAYATQLWLLEAGERGSQTPDPEEKFKEPVLCRIDEMRERVRQGEFSDGRTLAALCLELFRQEKF